MYCFRWPSGEAFGRPYQPYFGSDSFTAPSSWNACRRHPSEEHPLQLGPVWASWMHRGRAQCILCWLTSRPEQPGGSGGASYNFGSAWQRLPPSLHRARARPHPLKRIAHTLPRCHPPQVGVFKKSIRHINDPYIDTFPKISISIR